MEIRDELANLETPALEHDPRALIGEINAALARLRRHDGEYMDPTSVDHDPEAHRETLAPDSDELEALEREEIESLGEPPHWERK